MRQILNKIADSARQKLRPLTVRAENPAVAADQNAALKKAKKHIYWQASLALMTIVLTLVIIFTMTAAWYTNIVQANGLVIRAESWGFEGDIKVNSAPITAAPGDEGLIQLEVKSKSDSMSAVSVGASKSRLADYEMQKRLYFYVDTQAVRNEETVERVYLNSLDSYTYTVFGQGELTLTEKIHNGPQLKWQWVYDVLGYYVLGAWSEERGTLSELEYLRPIEYDYDAATTTFHADTETMELKTVDGETTPEEFLVELSKTDGYEGQIDPEKKKGSYYPVDVDEDGYGVYAYLCTYAEIEAATMYDTALAQAAAELEEGKEPTTYEMQLLISAQKNDENVMYTGTVEGLMTAIELNNGGTVCLTDDIVITEPVVLPAGNQLMLDLNGHTITNQVAGHMLDANNGSTLTLLNGSIVCAASKGYAVFAVGAEVVCSNVKIDNFTYGLCMADYREGNAMDSRVRLVNSEVNGKSAAVYVGGNGTMSAMKSQLIIEDSTLTGGTYALVGSGDTSGSGVWGTDIQIMNSELTGGSTAIYHPQKNSTLSIYNSTLSGHTGLALKGGTLAIHDSTVRGTGQREEPAFIGSGFSDTGDALYVETGYGYDIAVEIHGNSKLESAKAYSLEVFDANAPFVNVTIYGGTFNHEQPQHYIHSGSIQQQDSAGWTVTPRT